MSTSLAPDAGRLWRAGRAPLAVALLVLLAAVLLAALQGRTDRGLLDPRAVDPSGSLALARLLRDQGVQVDRVRSTDRARAAGAEATLLVAYPEVLTAPQLQVLQDTTADLVLVAPGSEPLAALAPGVTEAAQVEVERRAPRCPLPAARAAGEADLGGLLYRSRRGQRCYPAGSGGATLVQVIEHGRTVTVLGAPDPLTNDALGDAGNAALVLWLLGGNPRLVWYLPLPGELPPAQQRSFGELIPTGWRWGAIQLAVGVVLVAAWRARRLGPVVAEPLPVVVRAAEAVEGRARLYRRVGARDRAADTLRAATRRRLEPLLGLPPSAAPAALVDAAAGRARRRTEYVGAVLYGPPPVDDVALVRLRDDLHTLEREVRQS